MKKIILVGILILMLVMMLIPTLFAAGIPDNLPVLQPQNEAKTDINIGSSGILPTNPFYFVKEWGRGLRLALTFNSLSKTRYEMNIADAKLSELKAMEEIDPANNQAIITALGNYDANIYPLENRINSLKDIGNNSEVDQILRNLNAEMVRHASILTNLENNHADLTANFNAALSLVNKVLSQIPAKFTKASQQ